VIERGYFGRALQIVASDAVTYVVGGIVLHLVSLVAFGLLTGPAICGIVWITLKHCRGEEVLFGDLFRGYEIFGASFLAGIVFSLMVGAGLIFCIVPGLILGALFCFVFPFMLDRGLSFPDAMKASLELGKGRHDLLDRGFFFLLALLAGLSGIVLCGVGLLFTWPFMWAAIAVAYEDLAPEKPPAAPAD
jgi:uncharacterized membrane protein